MPGITQHELGTEGATWESLVTPEVAEGVGILSPEEPPPGGPDHSLQYHSRDLGVQRLGVQGAKIGSSAAGLAPPLTHLRKDFLLEEML